MAGAQLLAGIEFHPRTLPQIRERVATQKELLKPLQSIELNRPP